MEQRKHRLLVLVIVMVLHVPLFLAVLHALRPPRGATTAREPPLIVEFVLADATLRGDAALSVRRDGAESAAAPASVPPASRPPQPTSSVAVRQKPSAPPPPVAVATEPVEPTAVVPAEPTRDVRLFATDGSLRVSPHLAKDLADAEAARVAAIDGQRRTYHLPAGDTWVLREPQSPIDPGTTIFTRVWKPTDMNPVEEACWHNKGLRLLLTIIGSQDCADPGGKAARPTPSMIVYGVDDREEILRKHEDWQRYGER